MDNHFMNPAAGDVRRKALMQQLAQQAANRHAQNQNTSRFGQFSEADGVDYAGGSGNRFGRRGGRSITPGLAGGGVMARSGGGSGLNFTDAFTRDHGQGGGRGNGQAVGQVPDDQSSAPGVPAGPPGYGPGNLGPPGQPGSYGNVGGTDPTGTGLGDYIPGPINNGGAPGTPSPGGGGLVPLGGGVYFNPATGQIQGVAGGGTPGAAQGGGNAWRGLFG